MDCKTDHTFLPFDYRHCPDCGEELKDEEFEHNYEEEEEVGKLPGQQA